MAVSLGTLSPILFSNSGGSCWRFSFSTGVFPVGVWLLHDVIPRVELCSPVNGRLV